jgi:hypothetical protein
MLDCDSPAAEGATRADAAPELVAYVVNHGMPMPLVPAPSARAWMEATDRRFANRCLPLLVANQAGWFVLSAQKLRAAWSGDNGIGGVKIEYLEGPQPYPAGSHFGHGILTFSLPYLFRTPPGYNLLVRGPANMPKDGASALEGVVETDWCPATFTVNWQLTRRDHPVTFEVGEPIAMILPQRRGELESFRPRVTQLEDDAALEERYQSWAKSRADFLSGLQTPGSKAVEEGWQKDYFQGIGPDGKRVAEHQTKLRLHDFRSGRSEDV